MALFRRSRQKSDHFGESNEKNQLRGHAAFVLSLERRGLSHCTRHFPEDFTWNQLKAVTFQDVHKKYGIQNSNDLEKFAALLNEIRREDYSEIDDEVRVRLYKVNLN